MPRVAQWHCLHPATGRTCVVAAKDKDAARAMAARRFGVGEDETLVKYLSSVVVVGEKELARR